MPKQSYIKQFSFKYSFNVKKTAPFQIIQFSISMQFKCKYSFIVIVKNIAVSSYSV